MGHTTLMDNPDAPACRRAIHSRASCPQEVRKPARPVELQQISSIRNRSATVIEKLLEWIGPMRVFSLPLHHQAALFLLFAIESAAALGPDDRISYQGEIRPSVAESALSAELQVSVPMAPGAESIAFFINRGLEIDRLDGIGVTGFTLSPMEGNSLWSVLELSVDQDLVSSRLQFEVAYHGTPLFPNDAINAIESDWVELSIDSAWYPVLSTLAYPVRASIRIHLPSEWTLVTSGEVSISNDGWLLNDTIPQPDIAWAASPGMQAFGDRDVQVFHRGVDNDTLERVVDRAQACRTLLDERFSQADSLPSLRIVIAGRDESGYARKNYIVLSRVTGRPELDLTEFLCHELAHFWSRGAPPLSVDNWMNEGFAVLIAADAIKQLYSPQAFDRLVDAWRLRSAGAGSIWTIEDRSRRSHRVQYAKAPLFLHRLRGCMGTEVFEQLLSRYVTEPINSTERLIDHINDLAGPTFADWTVRQLGSSADRFMDHSCPETINPT